MCVSPRCRVSRAAGGRLDIAVAASFIRGPSFCPSTLKFALADRVTNLVSSSAKATSFTLSSSAITLAIGKRRFSKSVWEEMMMAFWSGWRTLRFFCSITKNKY